MKHRLVAIVAALIGSAVVPQAEAQTGPQGYPNREIRLVVTGTPGQGTDVLSRLIAQRLSERIKQAVVVQNRPGAGGNIGADSVAKATADGSRC